jgi:DivIVA domain-containing protein
VSETAGPTINPDDLASKSFDVVRRGFDPNAVRALLAEIAAELALLRRSESDLERRLAESEAARAPAEVDEESLVGAVGIETARVLQAAHDAARDIIARAERRASALVADAEGAFAERTRLAESEAAELRANVRDEVLHLQQKAREECREMVDEAREARRRILSDLVERRRALHLQLEQMRAGKDALAGIIESVSFSVVSSVEEVRARLETSEETARLAAASAAIDPLVEAELALDELGVAALGSGGAPRAQDRPPSLDEARVATDLANSEPIEHTDRTDNAASVGASVTETELVTETESVNDAESPSVTEELVEADEDRNVTESPGPQHATGATQAVADDVTVPSSEIDALFARIRSNRSDEVAAARTVLDTPLEPEAEPARDDAAGDGADEFTLLVRRDQLLGPAIAELGRSLKRALRVEENDLRDTARHLPKDPDALVDLVQPATLTRIVDASERSLAQARQSGASFVVELLGVDPVEVPGDEPRVVAERLAHEIVDPLRQRIESALRESDGDADPSVAVGVAFRDWRGSKVESVAGNFATWAFSSGAIAAAAKYGAPLTWIVDDGDTNCPDCEDNALAGAIEPGGEYPTGHGHPPIHPGCRCLLVPTAAN